LDDKVLAAWCGHSCLKVINNHGTFETKMHEVETTVAALVGLPTHTKPMRRFLLKAAPESVPPELHPNTFDVEKIYLRVNTWSKLRNWVRRRVPLDEGSELSLPFAFVRRRTQNGTSTFHYTFG
jgi:hypothetical protein